MPNYEDYGNGDQRRPMGHLGWASGRTDLPN